MVNCNELRDCWTTLQFDSFSKILLFSVTGASPALTIPCCYKQRAESLQLQTTFVNTDFFLLYKWVLGIATTLKLLCFNTYEGNPHMFQKNLSQYVLLVCWLVKIKQSLAFPNEEWQVLSYLKNNTFVTPVVNIMQCQSYLCNKSLQEWVWS